MLRAELGHSVGEIELDVAFDVPAGRCLALAGPSGAGKSTILRLLAGIVRPDRGRVTCGDDVWVDTTNGAWLPPERRRCGYVFQDYALFPHLSAWRNVAYGLRSSPGRTRKVKALSLLDRLGLTDRADAMPATLSGGERQRVALARALAPDPAVLLLDEPLSALDARTRASATRQLTATLRSLELPVVLVTHEFGEAALLGDEIGIIDDGAIIQRGSASELASRPSSAFVADFTGAVVLTGTARTDHRRAHDRRSGWRRRGLHHRSGHRPRRTERVSMGNHDQLTPGHARRVRSEPTQRPDHLGHNGGQSGPPRALCRPTARRRGDGQSPRRPPPGGGSTGTGHVEGDRDQAGDALNGYGLPMPRDLSLGEAATALGVSVDTLRRWDRSGRIITKRDERNRRLVPASEIRRLTERPERHRTGTERSARNRFAGVVRSVEADGVMALVELEAGPFLITAAITRDAIEELGLAAGVTATAVVKATSVMIERGSIA